ncbi:MAG: hypothetical protein K8R99_10955 [Actinomycetia bacterium]|nr:hypothetical protein [Actinomycetes bacterium]
MQRVAVAPEETVRHFHTWLPRQMVTVGLYGGLLTPVGLYFLDDNDHIGFANGRVVVDPVGQESMRVVTLVASGLVFVGWLLWTITAALNARGKSRWSISPLSLPMAYVFIAGLAVGASAFTENFTNKYAGPAVAIVLIVGVICHLGVLAAFRRAAVAIGAPDTPWTHVMVLPLAIGLISTLGAFFTQAISSQASYLAFSGLTFLLSLLMIASWVRAMATFDRSCVGRQMTHENMEIPAFLRAR